MKGMTHDEWGTIVAIWSQIVNDCHGGIGMDGRLSLKFCLAELNRHRAWMFGASMLMTSPDAEALANKLMHLAQMSIDEGEHILVLRQLEEAKNAA